MLYNVAFVFAMYLHVNSFSKSSNNLELYHCSIFMSFFFLTYSNIYNLQCNFINKYN